MDTHSPNSHSSFRGDICKDYFIKCYSKSSLKKPRLYSSRETLVSKLDNDSQRLKIITECMEKFGFKRKHHFGNEDICKRMKTDEGLFVNHKNYVSVNSFVSQINDGCKSNGMSLFSEKNINNKSEKNMSLMLKSFGEKLQHLKNSGCFAVNKDESNAILQHSLVPSSDALVYCNKFNRECFSSDNNFNKQSHTSSFPILKDHKNTLCKNSELKCNIFDICRTSEDVDKGLKSLHDKDLASKAMNFNLKLGEIFSKKKIKMDHENSGGNISLMNDTLFNHANSSLLKKSLILGKEISDQCLKISDSSNNIHAHSIHLDMPQSSHSSKSFTERISSVGKSKKKCVRQNLQSYNKVSLNFEKFKQIISFKNSIQTINSSNQKAKCNISSNVSLPVNNVSKNYNILNMSYNKMPRIKYGCIKRQPQYVILNKNIEKPAKKLQLKYLKMDRQRNRKSYLKKYSDEYLKNVKIYCNADCKEVVNNDASDDINIVNDRSIASGVMLDHNHHISDSIENSGDKEATNLYIIDNKTDSIEMNKCSNDTPCIENGNINEDDLFIPGKGIEIQSENYCVTNSINLECATLTFNQARDADDDDDDVENSVLSILSFCKEASDGFLSAQTSADIISTIGSNSVCISDDKEMDDNTFNVQKDFIQELKSSKDVKIICDPEKCDTNKNISLLLKESLIIEIDNNEISHDISHNDIKIDKDQLRDSRDVVNYDLFSLKKIIRNNDTKQIDGFVGDMCLKNNLSSIELCQTNLSTSSIKNSPCEFIDDNQSIYPCSSHAIPTTCIQSDIFLLKSNLEIIPRYIYDGSTSESDSRMCDGIKNINCDENILDDDQNLIHKKFMDIQSNEIIIESVRHSLDRCCDENKHIQDNIVNSDKSSKKHDNNNDDYENYDQITNNQIKDDLNKKNVQKSSCDYYMFSNMNNNKTMENVEDDKNSYCHGESKIYSDQWCNEALTNKEFDREGLFGSDSSTDDDGDAVDKVCPSNHVDGKQSNVENVKKANTVTVENKFEVLIDNNDDEIDDNDDEACRQLENGHSNMAKGENINNEITNKINISFVSTHPVKNFNNTSDCNKKDIDIVEERNDLYEDVYNKSFKDKHFSDITKTVIIPKDHWLSDRSDDNNNNRGNDNDNRGNDNDIGDFKHFHNAEHIGEDHSNNDKRCKIPSSSEDGRRIQLRNEFNNELCQTDENVRSVNLLKINEDSFTIQDKNLEPYQTIPGNAIGPCYRDHFDVNSNNNNINDQTFLDEQGHDIQIINNRMCVAENKYDNDANNCINSGSYIIRLADDGHNSCFDCSCGNQNKSNDDLILYETDSKINNVEKRIDSEVTSYENEYKRMTSYQNEYKRMTSYQNEYKRTRTKRPISSGSEIIGSNYDKNDGDDTGNSEISYLKDISLGYQSSNNNHEHKSSLPAKIFENYSDEYDSQNDIENRKTDDEQILSKTSFDKTSPCKNKNEQNYKNSCDIHGVDEIQNLISDNNNNNNNNNKSSSSISIEMNANNNSVNNVYLNETNSHNSEMNILKKHETLNFNISIDKNNINSNDNNPVIKQDGTICSLNIKSDLENDKDIFAKQYSAIMGNINDCYDNIHSDTKKDEKFSDFMSQYAKMYSKIGYTNNSMNIYQCLSNSLSGLYGNFEDIYCDFPENQIGNIYKHYFLAKNYRDLCEAYNYANNYDIFTHYNDLIKMHSRTYPYENIEEEYNGLDLRIKTNQNISETLDQCKILDDTDPVPMDLIVNKETHGHLDLKDNASHNQYCNFEENNLSGVIESKYSLRGEVDHEVTCHEIVNNLTVNDGSGPSKFSRYYNFSHEGIKVDKVGNDDNNVDNVSIGDFVDFGASNQVNNDDNNIDENDEGNSDYIKDFVRGRSENIGEDIEDKAITSDKNTEIYNGVKNLICPIVVANGNINKTDNQDKYNVNNNGDNKDGRIAINDSSDKLGDNVAYKDTKNNDAEHTEVNNNDYDSDNYDGIEYCLLKHVNSKVSNTSVDNHNAIERYDDDLSMDHTKEFSKNFKREKCYAERKSSINDILGYKITSLPISFVLKSDNAKCLETKEIDKFDLTNSNANSEVISSQQSLSCSVEKELSDKSSYFCPESDYMDKNGDFNSRNFHLRYNNNKYNNNGNKIMIHDLSNDISCDKHSRSGENDDCDKLCDVSDGSNWADISCNEVPTKHCGNATDTNDYFINVCSCVDDKGICVKIDSLRDADIDTGFKNKKYISPLVIADFGGKGKPKFEATFHDKQNIGELCIQVFCADNCDQNDVLECSKSVTNQDCINLQKDFSSGNILNEDDNDLHNKGNKFNGQELININDRDCFKDISELNLESDDAFEKENSCQNYDDYFIRNGRSKESVSSNKSHWQHKLEENIELNIAFSGHLHKKIDENKNLESVKVIGHSDEIRIVTGFEIDNHQNNQYSSINVLESSVDIVKVGSVADGCSPFSDAKISTNTKSIVNNDTIDIYTHFFDESVGNMRSSIVSNKCDNEESVDKETSSCCDVIKHEDKSGCCRIVLPTIHEEKKNIGGTQERNLDKNIDIEVNFRGNCNKEIAHQNFIVEGDTKEMDSTNLGYTKGDCKNVSEHLTFLKKHKEDIPIENITTPVNNYEIKNNPLHSSEYLKSNFVDLAKLDVFPLFEKYMPSSSSTLNETVPLNIKINEEINNNDNQFKDENCDISDISKINFKKLDETLNVFGYQETLKPVDNILNLGKHSSLFCPSNSIITNSFPLDQPNLLTEKLKDESIKTLAKDSEVEKNLTHLLDGFEFSSGFSSNSNSSLNGHEDTSKMLCEVPPGDDDPEELQAAVESILNIDFFSTKYASDPVESIHYDCSYFATGDELIPPSIKEGDQIDLIDNEILNQVNSDTKDIDDEEDEASRDGKELAMKFYSSCQKKEDYDVFKACSTPSDIFHGISMTINSSPLETLHAQNLNSEYNSSQINKSNFFKSFKSKWMNLNSSESHHLKIQSFEKFSIATNVNTHFSEKYKRWKNKKKLNQFNLSLYFSQTFIRKYQKLNFSASRRKEAVRRWKRKYIKDFDDLNHLIVCLKNKLYIGYEPSDEYSLNEFKNKNIFYLGSPCGMSSCSFIRKSESGNCLEDSDNVAKVLLKKPVFVYDTSSFRRTSFVKTNSKHSSIECQQLSSPNKSSIESEFKQNSNLSCKYKEGKNQSSSQNLSCILSDAFKSSFEITDSFRDCDYPLLDLEKKDSFYYSDNSGVNRLSQGSCQMKFKNEIELKSAISFYEESSNMPMNLELKHDHQYNMHLNRLPSYIELNNQCSPQKGKQIINRPIRPTPLYNGGFSSTMGQRFSNYKLNHFTAQIPIGKSCCLPIVENIYNDHQQSIIPSESNSSATLASDMKTRLKNQSTSKPNFSSRHNDIPNFTNQRMAYNHNNSFNYMENSSRNVFHTSSHHLQHKYLQYANFPSSYRYPVSYPRYCSTGIFSPDNNIALQETSSSAEIVDNNHRTALMKSHINEKEFFKHSHNNQLNPKNVIDLQEAYMPRYPTNPSMYDTYMTKTKKIVDRISSQELSFPKTKIEKSKEVGMNHLNIMHNVLSKNSNSRLGHGRATHKANYQIENILMNPGNAKNRNYKKVMPSSLDQSNPSISHSYYQTNVDAGFAEIPIYKFYATPERLYDYQVMSNNNIEHHNPSHPHNYRSHFNLSNVYRNSLSSNKFSESYYKDY